MTPKRAGHEGFDVGVISKEEFLAKIKQPSTRGVTKTW